MRKLRSQLFSMAPRLGERKEFQAMRSTRSLGQFSFVRVHAWHPPRSRLDLDVGLKVHAIMNGKIYNKQRRGGVSCSAMFLLSLLLILPSIALLHLAHQFDFRWVSCYILFVWSITYLIYRKDKTRAECGAWRIPEATIHFLELIGGWPAGFIAQRNFRHKASKVSYQILFWAIILLHEALCLDYLRGWKFAIQIMALTRQ